MSKQLTPKTNPASPPFTGLAYVAYKVDDLLCESAELTIVNGIVTKSKVLTRGADLPVVAISKCQMGLWKSYKTQRGEAQ